MSHYTKDIVLAFASIFCFLACESNKQDDFSVSQTTPLEVFDPIASEAQYVLLSSEAQWHYLNDLLEIPYSNEEDFKPWIKKKLSARTKVFDFDDATVINNIAKKLYELDYKDASLVIADYIFNGSESLDLKNSKGVAAVLMCHHYMFINEKDSVAVYLKLMEESKLLDTTKWLKTPYFSNKAFLAELNGQFFEATVNYHNAIAYTDPDDHKNLTTLYLNLASMYITLDYNEKAEFYAQKILEYVKIDDLSMQNVGSLALIQSKVGDFDQADLNFQKIIYHAQKNDKPMLLAQTYANYGNLKRKQKQYQEGLRFMDLSDSICAALGVDFGILVNGINRAELYYDQQKFDIAHQILQSSEALLSNYNIPKLKKEYYKLFYKIQDSLGNKVLANQYYRAYRENHEVFFGDVTRSVIAEWELASERELNIKEKTTLALTVEKQKKGIYFISFLLTLTIFIIGLFYFFAHRRRIIEKETAKRDKLSLSYALEMKSKEMLSDTLNNLNVQHTKQWILEELQTLIDELPTQHQPPFKELKRRLKIVKQKNFLEEFEVRFNGVYEDFYERILQISPELTPKELRLCALMRLNISSKEIAMLTNRSLGTIENARINIRKKLNLDSQVNLQHFLMTI
jgi:DNA-binding CsgD family transcriptional regulator